LNWLPIIIDPGLTGNEIFNAVKFYNQNFGVIGGKAGLLYVYHNPFPLVFTSMATEITLNSARLNGSIDAGGFPTAVKFEYGTSTSYGNEIIGVPASTSGIGNVDVYALPSGLIPNTTYHFRVKGISNGGVNVGNDMQFYSGYPEIPNFNFEIWNTWTSLVPSSFTFFKERISQYTPGSNSNYAVSVMNNLAEDEPGAILLGNSSAGSDFSGGTPFNVRPDSLSGCFNYSIVSGDTALVFFMLKKQGVFVANNIYKIYGNSSGNFNNLKFPIQYSSSDVPDSLILGFASSDFRNLTQFSSANYLIIDDIHFTGTALTIPNHDFEDWDTVNRVTLSDWWYDKRDSPFNSIPETVFRSLDAQSGTYAAILRNVIIGSDSITGRFYSGKDWGPDFKVNAKHQRLTGYYKFQPENNDTLFIMVNMYKNGQQIGYGILKQGAVVIDYTPFSLNIDYDSDTIVPDSAQIKIATTTFNKAHGNSVLYIDNLNFDGFLSSGIKEPALTATGNFDFNVYPNPFSEQATVSFSLIQDENVMIRLFDLSGKQVALLADSKYKSGEYKINLSASELKKGFYICVINTGDKIDCKKIIIQ
jgi:hypothetical protein